ncbi:MAG TPA: RNA-binding protein [Firmicutes bacterium]|nr:RNA-binding protein [Bacillota bacterium]
MSLVLSGEKRATTSLYNEYIKNKEPLPKIGEKSIIQHDNNNDTCLIEVENVIITEFKNITEELAFIEGEGDKSLEYYRNEHYKIFKKIDSNFNDESKVVFEMFKVIEKYN